jgi:hypothetical protein
MGKYEEEYTSLISLKKTHVKKIEDMAYYMSWISPLKTLSGKIGDITYCCTDIVSLKTFYENLCEKKKLRGKRVQYDVWKCYISGELPLNLATIEVFECRMDLESEPTNLSLDYFCKMFISNVLQLAIYGDKTF